MSGKKKSAKLPSFRALAANSFNLVKSNWRLIGAVTAIYAVIYFVFASGISRLDLADLRGDLEENLGLKPDSFGGRVVVATAVLQAAGSLEGAATGYMTLVTLVVVLALLWALRHAWNKRATTLRDAFYKAMYPLVPFGLLCIRAVVQLLPLLAGSYLLALGLQNGTFVSGAEVAMASTLLLLLPAIWSSLMLINTVFALIIVTIPETTPSGAYREAKQLLKSKRAYVFKNLLIGGLLWLILAGGTLVVAIALWAPIAPWLGLLFSIALLPAMTSFIYTIYRRII